ncbi:MAG: ATP-binding protein [Paraclostridium sp.]
MIEKVKKQEGPSYSEKSKNLEIKCELCRDMLFIMQSDGTAKECTCRQLRIVEEKLKASGVSDEFRKMRFENYEYEKNVQVMEAYLKAKNYSKTFEEIRVARKNSIIFLGQVGSGKTHLGMAISNSLLDKSVGVIYMPYRNSITKLKQSITDGENYQREINVYKEAQVLFIDDLFKGRYTESDINIMYEIIDYRYLKSLPMIITTEKSLDNLIEIDEAIGSRIYEMSKNYVIEIEGSKLNYRLHGA